MAVLWQKLTSNTLSVFAQFILMIGLCFTTGDWVSISSTLVGLLGFIPHLSFLTYLQMH